MPITMSMSYNGGAASINAAARAKLSEVVKKTARDVNAQAVVEIAHGEKSGRIYSRRGVEHQASAPDEAPASDTSALMASISPEDVAELESDIIVGQEYGLYLEVGTVRIAPRPFLAPAITSVEIPFRAACAAAINGAGGT